MCYFICYSRLSNDDDDFAMLRRDEVAAMFLRQPPSLLDSGVDVSAAHGWESEQNNCTILAEWNANSQDYTPTEDDDFFQLGFRPQDEITTELWLVVSNPSFYLWSAIFFYQNWAALGIKKNLFSLHFIIV